MGIKIIAPSQISGRHRYGAHSIDFTGGEAIIPDDGLPESVLTYMRDAGYDVQEGQPDPKPDASKATNPNAPSAPTPLFDPGEHTVADIVAYLALADDTERARVKAAEADGQDRVTIRDWTPTDGDTTPAEGDTK